MNKYLKVALAWLVGVYLIAIFVPQGSFFPFSYEAEGVAEEFPQALWHLANFDGVHYQNISFAGYIAPFQTAFFPLYPLLVKILGFLVGNHLISALLISALSLLGAASVLQRLKVPLKAFLLLLAYPFAFFLAAGYTESLFLFLALASLLAFKEKRYFLCGILGLLCSLTKFYGIFLFAYFAIEYFLQNPVSLKKVKPVLPLLLIPLGLGLYMLWLQLTYNDPLKFIHALSLWQKSEPTFPLQTLFRYAKILTTVSPGLWIYWVALMELVSVLVGLLGLLWMFRKKWWGPFIYVALGLLLPLSTGTLQSLPRYLLAMFPLIFIFYENIPGKIYRPVIAVGFVLQGIFLLAFLRGWFIA